MPIKGKFWKNSYARKLWLVLLANLPCICIAAATLISLGKVIQAYIPDLKEHMLSSSMAHRDHCPAEAPSDWCPERNYSLQVQKALAVLNQYAPSSAVIVQKYGMPIIMVPGAEWTHGPYAAGFTSDDGIVQINTSIANTPERIALVLYHELIHVQAGLHDPTVYRASMFMRILTENEESVAHTRTLLFGLCHNQQLHGAIYAILSGHLRSGLWRFSPVIDFLVYVWPLGWILVISMAGIKACRLVRRGDSCAVMVGMNGDE